MAATVKQTAISDSDGKFVFKDLEPGTYKLRADGVVSNRHRKAPDTPVIVPKPARTVKVRSACSETPGTLPRIFQAAGRQPSSISRSTRARTLSQLDFRVVRRGLARARHRKAASCEALAKPLAHKNSRAMANRERTAIAAFGRQIGENTLSFPIPAFGFSPAAHSYCWIAHC